MHRFIERNSRGITRTVFLIGRWALKVPTPRYGLWSLARGVIANLNEQQWSGVAGLCPVKWSAFGIVNVYPRCAPVHESTVIDWAKVAPMFSAADRKHENLGWLNGKLVWVDYDGSWNGCPHARSAHDLTDES